MTMVVLIAPNFLSGRALGLMSEALRDKGIIVKHALAKAAQESWILCEEKDDLLPITDFDYVVLTQIKEREFRLVLYE